MLKRINDVSRNSDTRNNNKSIAIIIFASLLILSFAIFMSGCSQASNSNNDSSNETTSSTNSYDNSSDDSISPKNAQQELLSPSPLEVVDYGWFPAENNMVNFSVMIQNPNAYVAAKDISLTVTGIDENGNAFFADTIELSRISPDTDYTISYLVGDENDNPKLPADIAFSIDVPDGSWFIDGDVPATYLVDESTVSPSDIEGVNMVTGTVTSNLDEIQQVMVNVILYDSNNSMMGGYYDIIELDGTTTEPYSVYMIDAPEYAGYEVFVSPYVFE